MGTRGARVLVAAFVLAAGLGGIRVSAAQDAPPAAPADPDPGVEYAGRRAAAHALVAKKLLALAEWCRGQGLRTSAASLYGRVLEFAPDDATARAQLGYRREGEAWKPPAAPVKASPDSTDPARTTALANRRKATGKECAKDLVDLARWCGEAKLDRERKAALFRAVDFDGENAAAREGLGFVRQGAAWIHPARAEHAAWEEALRAWARADVSTPVFRQPVEGVSEWEAAAGRPIAVSRSRHFVVHSTRGKEGTDHLIVVAEQGRQFLEHVLGTKLGGGNPTTLVLLDDKAAYERVVGKLYEGDPGKVAVAMRLNAARVDRLTVAWRADSGVMEDLLIHHAVEFGLHDGFPWAQRRPWLREGLPYLATGTMRSTAWTWCVSLKESASRKDDYDEIPKWPAALRKLVLEGRDEDLAAIAAMGLNDFQTETIAKAWSVLGWLAEKRPKELVRFLSSFDSTGAAEGPAATAFSEDLATLDREWREWVRLAY